jgi:hypothetical protein
MTRTYGLQESERHLRMGVTEPGIRTRLAEALAGLILLFGLLTAAFSAYATCKTYSPVVYWDQWSVVHQLALGGGHLTAAQLWKQHNEHRILWNRLACWADLEFFGGNNVSLLIEIYAVQATTALLLSWFFWRYSGLGMSQKVTAAGFFIFCLFHPIQMENFTLGFQIAFVSTPLAAAMAIAAMIIHTNRILPRTPRAWWSWWLTGSIAAAFVAETSLASGTLVWPILSILSFVLKLPRKTRGVIAMASLLAIGAFLVGFHSPGNHAKPLESLRQPMTLTRYILAYFAWSWDPIVPTGRWLNFAQWCALLAIGFVLAAAFVLIKFRETSTVEIFLLTYMIFLLGNAFLTALGRINFGLNQATSSRYQTIALIFWACLACLALIWRSGMPHGVTRFIEIQVVLLLLMAGALPRYSTAFADADTRRKDLAAAYAALVQDPSNVNVAAKLSPYPNLPEAYNYLLAYHLGPDALSYRPVEGSLIPLSPSQVAQWKPKWYRVAPPEYCRGNLEWVKTAPGGPDLITAGGWAWNQVLAKPADKVLLLLEDGHVAGSGDMLVLRPDIRSQISGIRDAQIGWIAGATLPRTSAMRAYAFLADLQSICPLPNEFTRH